MIAIKPSPSTSSGTSASFNLHARLEAATEALLKTRDQVIEALDHHLEELDMLRRSLSLVERPQHIPAPQAVIAPAPFVERAHLAPPPALSAPLMTQILWPSKSQPEQTAFAPLEPISAPIAPSRSTAVSSPLVAFPSLQTSASQEMAMDPNLELATLDELNAALAYAFSHVSNARTSPSGR